MLHKKCIPPLKKLEYWSFSSKMFKKKKLLQLPSSRRFEYYSAAYVFMNEY